MFIQALRKDIKTGLLVLLVVVAGGFLLKSAVGAVIVIALSMVI